ncbi:hypothetical protein SAMN04487869_1034 [Marinobacter sp. DSM 26671]|jgi:hypothetical protein|uniref:Uncharacterized protein n=1 Tax=Marinobacter manganoxydans MnI7-9 TaxID=1094979 RepID=G6YUB8_9GAMM|nr:hypothetical protein ACP86_06135 [Marinobacter sp. CP1]EHJ04212.1 hypothetical protein KYE_12305 [Marinobacter manganoxydans MnI7-9]SFE07746.1 hypothetical protein SAMN04487869_1034 [Marinobacter sp. DSM 26671]
MLANKRRTLWNTDSRQWSKLPNFEQEVSRELAARLVDQVSRRLKDDEVEERTKPYRTPVTEEELRYTIR